MESSTTITEHVWRKRAECRSADPTLFDDVELAKWPPPRVVEAAHDFCAACPVRAACDDAAARAKVVGLWGGKWRHSLDDRNGWFRLEVTDLLVPELVARFDPPTGVGGRRLKVWEAMPAEGFTTPGEIADATGLDQRDVSQELGWLARRGIAFSPRRGVWRRDDRQGLGHVEDLTGAVA